jgi:hypothetical protein
MGYYMNSHESNFFIPVSDVLAVLEVLNEDVDEPVKTIEDAFLNLNFMVNRDSLGNVNDIWVEGGNFSFNLDEKLQTIAPYVRSGSYLIMQGDDGCYWKWAFLDGKCTEINGGAISFEHIYDVEYELIMVQSHQWNDREYAKSETFRFTDFQKAYDYMMRCHYTADSIEPIMHRETDSQRATQIGYLFKYAEGRQSGAPGGDEVAVTIRRVTYASPIEEFLLPRLPQIKAR